MRKNERVCGWISMLPYLVLLGLVLRVFLWQTIPVTGDAGYHYKIGKFIAENYRFPVFEYVTGPDPMWYPPAFHVATALLYKITGILELAPILYGILGVFLYFVFLKRFYPELACPGVLMLAYLPFHVYYSGVGYATVSLFFWSLFTYYSYMSFRQTGGNNYFVLTILGACASALTHYHGVVPLLAITLHLFFTDRRRAVTLFVISLIIVSPWFIRNYQEFGNPVWPFLYGGKYPGEIQSHKPHFTETFSVTRWTNTFLDYWIGAPNSGEDLFEKLGVVEDRVPFIKYLAYLWILVVLVLSAMSVYGFWLLRSDKYFRLMLLVFGLSIIPSLFNFLARMFTAFIPFMVLGFARAFSEVRLKEHLKVFILMIVLLGIVAAPTGYAIFYKERVDRIIPFYDEMNSLGGSSLILLPFNTPFCVYYTGMDCLRVRQNLPGGIPSYGRLESSGLTVLAERNVTHVCCESLYWGSFQYDAELFCKPFENIEPVIDYSWGGMWGKCWRLTDLE